MCLAIDADNLLTIDVLHPLLLRTAKSPRLPEG